jgi:hypothetical protein
MATQVGDELQELDGFSGSTLQVQFDSHHLEHHWLTRSVVIVILKK